MGALVSSRNHCCRGWRWCCPKLHECRARDSRVIGVTESPFFLVVLGVTLFTYYVHEIARPNMHEEMLAHSGQKSKIGTWPILPNVTTPNRYSRNNCYCTVDSILLGHDVKEAKQVPWNRNKRVKSAFVQRLCRGNFFWLYIYTSFFHVAPGFSRHFMKSLSIKKKPSPCTAAAALCNDTMTAGHPKSRGLRRCFGPPRIHQGLASLLAGTSQFALPY